MWGYNTFLTMFGNVRDDWVLFSRNVTNKWKEFGKVNKVFSQENNVIEICSLTSALQDNR